MLEYILYTGFLIFFLGNFCLFMFYVFYVFFTVVVVICVVKKTFLIVPQCSSVIDVVPFCNRTPFFTCFLC